jgi:hypothetical protein
MVIAVIEVTGYPSDNLRKCPGSSGTTGPASSVAGSEARSFTLRDVVPRAGSATGAHPRPATRDIVTGMSERYEKEKREREIARLKSYYRYGPMNPYAGMHFRHLKSNCNTYNVIRRAL